MERVQLSRRNNFHRCLATRIWNLEPKKNPGEEPSGVGLRVASVGYDSRNLFAMPLRTLELPRARSHQWRRSRSHSRSRRSFKVLCSSIHARLESRRPVVTFATIRSRLSFEPRLKSPARLTCRSLQRPARTRFDRNALLTHAGPIRTDLGFRSIRGQLPLLRLRRAGRPEGTAPGFPPTGS